MKSFFKSARSAARTHFENAFQLDAPPCNTGGFENKYKLTERGDLMKVSFYCPVKNELLTTTELPSNVTEYHLSMIAGFMAKEADLPSDHIVFHDAVIRKFFSLKGAKPLSVNEQIQAIEHINFEYAQSVKAA